MAIKITNFYLKWHFWGKYRYFYLKYNFIFKWHYLSFWKEKKKLFFTQKLLTFYFPQNSLFSVITEITYFCNFRVFFCIFWIFSVKIYGDYILPDQYIFLSKGRPWKNPITISPKVSVFRMRRYRNFR